MKKKMIKAELDSKAVLALFGAERRRLAVMRHPNIAKVLDGGLYDGWPFFVMEFFLSSRRRNTSFSRDWSSDVCSSDLSAATQEAGTVKPWEVNLVCTMRAP